jgi:hypothetical protein
MTPASTSEPQNAHHHARQSFLVVLHGIYGVCRPLLCLLAAPPSSSMGGRGMRRARSNAALLLPSAFRRRYAPLPGGALLRPLFRRRRWRERVGPRDAARGGTRLRASLVPSQF